MNMIIFDLCIKHIVNILTSSIRVSKYFFPKLPKIIETLEGDIFHYFYKLSLPDTDLLSSFKI
jgi:hypothetical protein